MMVRGRTVVILLILTVFATSFLTIALAENGDFISLVEDKVSNENQAGSRVGKAPNDMEKFIEAFNKIHSSYIEDKSDSELIDGAIAGMVQTLNDPHSTYMDAEQAKAFFGSLSDSFEGIGAEVTMENGKVTIVAPIKGSPSEKAGLRPKDQILKVNGESLEGFNLIEAVNKIRGPKGTNAVLEISRPSLSEPFTITVIRDEIPIETVETSTFSTRKGLIGKIEIKNFGERTSEEFKQALAKLENGGIKGLIIDVRGNPGGYLQSVLDIGDLVIPNNGVIVQIEGKTGQKQVYRSKMLEAKYPIVALIDGGSASASEILAAALHESGKYTLVGVKSYGKGTVQNPYQLSDGSNLKLTIAKWLTPHNNWIHKKGIEPDIKVEQPDYYFAFPIKENVTLKYDMNDNQVSNLQVILNGLGYKTKRSDGYFDRSTESAVKAFQKINGLKETGVVDNGTAVKLQEEIINKIKDPKSDMQLQVAIEALLKKVK